MYLGPPKDIRDMEIFLGVVERCPNFARAATSKAEMTDFSEFLDEDSIYKRQPVC
jgi:hypothetical protein